MPRSEITRAMSKAVKGHRAKDQGHFHHLIAYIKLALLHFTIYIKPINYKKHGAVHDHGTNQGPM